MFVEFRFITRCFSFLLSVD